VKLIETPHVEVIVEPHPLAITLLAVGVVGTLAAQTSSGKLVETGQSRQRRLQLFFPVVAATSQVTATLYELTDNQSFSRYLNDRVRLRKCERLVVHTFLIQNYQRKVVARGQRHGMFRGGAHHFDKLTGKLAEKINDGNGCRFLTFLTTRTVCASLNHGLKLSEKSGP